MIHCRTAVKKGPIGVDRITGADFFRADGNCARESRLRTRRRDRFIAGHAHETFVALNRTALAGPT